MRQVCDLFEAIPVNGEALKFVGLERIQSTMVAAMSAIDSARASISKIGIGGRCVIHVAFIRNVTGEHRHEILDKRAVAIRNAVHAGAMGLINGDSVVCVSRWLGSPGAMCQVSVKRYNFDR